MHFTHIENLAAIVRDGLLADTVVRASASSPAVEIGNNGIKESRRLRRVPLPPGGVVGDYAPFYFAPRSPMMYAIEAGNVPTYSGGCDRIIYLVTTVERLVGIGLNLVFTDRNAVLTVAEYAADLDRLDSLVDWPLMKATYWNNTREAPDRRERRMAECLVHRRVPWEGFAEIVTKNRACEHQAREVLSMTGADFPYLSDVAGTSKTWGRRK